MVNGKGLDTNGDPRVVNDGSKSIAEMTEDATVSVYNPDDLLMTRYLPWNSDDTRKFKQEFQRNQPLGRVTSILSPHEVEDDSVPRTSYTYWQNDWVQAMSDEKLGTDPSSQARVKSRLISYDYDRQGNQTGWTSKNNDTAAGRTVTRTFWPNGQLSPVPARKSSSPTARPPPGRTATSTTQTSRCSRWSTIAATPTRRPPGPPSPSATPRSASSRSTRGGRARTATPCSPTTRPATSRSGSPTVRSTAPAITTPRTTRAASRPRRRSPTTRWTAEIHMTGDPNEGANRSTTTFRWPSGARAERVKPNGTHERWNYNTRGGIVHFQRQRADQSGNDLARDISYAYDGNGNRTIDERGSHVYNARNQLARWTRPSNGRQTTYTLNGDGAITRKLVHASGDASAAVVSDTTFSYRGERLKQAESAEDRATYRLPRSSSPVAQGGSARTGRWWEYDDVSGQRKIVVEHPDGTVHVGIPKPQSTHATGGPPSTTTTATSDTWANSGIVQPAATPSPRHSVPEGGCGVRGGPGGNRRT